MKKLKVIIAVAILFSLVLTLSPKETFAAPSEAGLLRGIAPDGTRITEFTDGIDSTLLSVPDPGDEYTWTLNKTVNINEYYYVASSILHLSFYNENNELIDTVVGKGKGVTGTQFIKKDIPKVKKVVVRNMSTTTNNTAALSEIDIKTNDVLIPPVEEPQPIESERALLTIYLSSGLIKEYDLPVTTINNFISWYNVRTDGLTSPAAYQFLRDYNKAKFLKRYDYIPFSKIELFEVDEY
nr:hypothetical protein [Paenibacillus xylanexedens]